MRRLLIGLCVVSFVLQLVVPDWTVRWLFQPYAAFFEPWRFLTAAFLHSPGQYLHIVFNMVALWFVGPTLEKTLGRARYITLYLMSAVGGSVVLTLLDDRYRPLYQSRFAIDRASTGERPDRRVSRRRTQTRR